MSPRAHATFRHAPSHDAATTGPEKAATLASATARWIGVLALVLLVAILAVGLWTAWKWGSRIAPGGAQQTQEAPAPASDSVPAAPAPDNTIQTLDPPPEQTAPPAGPAPDNDLRARPAQPPADPSPGPA